MTAVVDPLAPPRLSVLGAGLDVREIVTLRCLVIVLIAVVAGAVVGTARDVSSGHVNNLAHIVRVRLRLSVSIRHVDITHLVLGGRSSRRLSSFCRPRKILCRAGVLVPCAACPAVAGPGNTSGYGSAAESGRAVDGEVSQLAGSCHCQLE